MTNDVKRIAQAIKSRDEAEMLLRRIGNSMVKLVQIFEQETKLIEVGSGRECRATDDGKDRPCRNLSARDRTSEEQFGLHRPDRPGPGG